MRAHGYDLTGKMTGGGLRSVACASAITLVETSVIALAHGRRLTGKMSGGGLRSVDWASGLDQCDGAGPPPSFEIPRSLSSLCGGRRTSLRVWYRGGIFAILTQIRSHPIQNNVINSV